MEVECVILVIYGNGRVVGRNILYHRLKYYNDSIIKSVFYWQGVRKVERMESQNRFQNVWISDIGKGRHFNSTGKYQLI